MSLRRKLTLLLSVFALYAVAMTGLTIYTTRWRVDSAVAKFEYTAGQTLSIDHMMVNVEELSVLLRNILDRGADAIPRYSAARDDFHRHLHQVTAFSFQGKIPASWSTVLDLVEQLEKESNLVLKLADEGQSDSAELLLIDRLENDLQPRLRKALIAAKAELSEERNVVARALTGMASWIFVSTLIVAVLAAGLVVLGAVLLQKWMFCPLKEIRSFVDSHSGLTYESDAEKQDELSALKKALSRLAGNLTASERKYRGLFSGLQDSVVICDHDGRITDYHEGSPGVLGVERLVHIGKPLLEVWPEWATALSDWTTTLKSAASGRRIQVSDVAVITHGSAGTGQVFDFVIYGFDEGESRKVAVLVRDVTERARLQVRLRRGEALEAVGAMAGAFAHDLNNLLTSVVGTLSRLHFQLENSVEAGRIEAALRTCRRAAGLSKRLLNYASGAQGTPQAFKPAEIIETILGSTDPAFLNGLVVDKELDPGLTIYMDQDQFAQIALNLLRNAKDAIRGHGRVQVSLTQVLAHDPVKHAHDRSFALFSVRDSGCGMSKEVRARLFEPFFSTKNPGNGGRGMGLSIVHTAVSHAGGFIEIETAPGSGTVFRVYLPLVDPANSFSNVPTGASSVSLT